MIKIYNYNKVMIGIIAIGLALMNSCTEDITLDTGVAFIGLSVEGSITTDTIKHKVRLVKSRALGDTHPFEGVSNADVTISDGFSVFLLKENQAEKGSYYTDSTVYGVPGKTYTLNIRNVDVNGDGVMEEYSAQSLLKSVNPIDSFFIIYNYANEHMKGWSFNLFAKDQGGGRNFFLTKARKNGDMLTDSIYQFGLGENLGFEGGEYKGHQALFVEENPHTRINMGDTITLELSGVTEDYYNYLFASLMDYYPKTPIFSGPSANMPTNIVPKDKAVGFFAAYSIQRKTRIYK